jgi:hypothetical protein
VNGYLYTLVAPTREQRPGRNGASFDIGDVIATGAVGNPTGSSEEHALRAMLRAGARKISE